MFGQGFQQLFGQLQTGQQLGAQAQQGFAQVLQRIAFFFQVGAGLVPGAFEFGLQLQVTLAAFSNEHALHVIAFFRFA